MQDVHEFDRKITFPVLEDFELDKEIIDYFFEKLGRDSGIMFLRILSTQNPNNIDNINNCNATIILKHILKKIKENHYDLIPILDEQLNDCFNLGECPQGRTIRMLQIYNLLS